MTTILYIKSKIPLRGECRLGLKGILLWEATKLSNITKPCNNMHYKAGKYSRKGVIVCRGIQSAYKMGSIPYLSTRLFIDVL
jgi:hypothetical protein